MNEYDLVAFFENDLATEVPRRFEADLVVRFALEVRALALKLAFDRALALNVVLVLALNLVLRRLFA